MTAILTEAQVHPETMPEDDDGSCILCVECYGWKIPFGAIVQTLCGRVEPFDEWNDEPLGPDDCKACLAITVCPKCGTGIER